MSYSLTLDTLVLASYDVGEADRFVILLTREKGRLAARVPGARRLTSKLAGLLPLTRSTAEIREHGENALVTGAAECERLGSGDVARFLLHVQGMELLLALLHDGEPVPQIFDAAVAFLRTPDVAPHHLMAFSFRLLHLLGVLPESDAERFARLTPDERAFIEQSAHGVGQCKYANLKHLLPLSQEMLAEHITRALKAPAVAEAMVGKPAVAAACHDSHERLTCR